MSLASSISMIPRTLYHILTVPDMAVTWKWGVLMPSDIPEPYEGFKASVDATPEQSEGSGLWNSIKSMASKVANVAGEVSNQLNVSSLCMRAESINIPFENITSTTTRTQARSRNFPDQLNADSVNITFYEDYNFTTLTYLEKWKKCIVNEYGVFRLPSGKDGYARDIVAYLFDSVGLLKGEVTFSDCYPEQITPVNFNSASEAVKVSCSFSVQQISWRPAGLNLGALGSVGKSVIQGVTSGNLADTGKSTINGIKSLF